VISRYRYHIILYHLISLLSFCVVPPKISLPIPAPPTCGQLEEEQSEESRGAGFPSVPKVLTAIREREKRLFEYVIDN